MRKKTVAPEHLPTDASSVLRPGEWRIPREMVERYGVEFLNKMNSRREGGAAMNASEKPGVTIGHPTQFITFDRGVLAAVKESSATTYPVTPHEAKSLATALLAWADSVELTR